MNLTMPARREFLGWDGPCLPKTAQWLRARHERDGQWDLSGVLLVTPGRRAARRLLEVLVEHAGGAVLVPPAIVTAGDLPEHLYTPPLPLASPLQTHLALMHVLRQADPSAIAALLPHPPDAGDLSGWLRLAADLDRLFATLAADDVPVDQVATRCQELPDFADEDRWQVLSQLHQQHVQTLTEAGCLDRHEARRRAWTERRCAAERDIILIATLDLGVAARHMLEQVADRVTALIHAPPDQADAFDALGCTLVDQWHDRHVALAPERVRMADRPRDQAYDVVRIIDQTSRAGPSLATPNAPALSADQITVGLGDETLGPLIERTLDLAGLPARPSVGRDLSQTAPALLLLALGRYAGNPTLDHFAALLRHPDLETHLRANTPTPPHAALDAIHDWLTLLDRYLTDHLHGKLSGSWLGDAARAARLQAVHQALTALLPADAGHPRPLPHWAEPIASVLMAVYGGRPLKRDDAADAQIIRSLQQIGDALRDQAALPAHDPAVPQVAFAQAISVLASQLAGQALPPEEGTPAIELLGWLELQLDDAPVLIVTAFNDGAIPQSLKADAFLPDHVRRAIGLADNRRRYARDVAMLTAILHSRPHVTLIAGRRGADDEPLVPSRLLLARPDGELAPVLIRFYGDERTEPEHLPAPWLLATGRTSRFVIPPPQPPDTPLTRLRVTAFRDYLACPYRFYLQHVLKLEALGDRVPEMDALAFGSVAHQVLQRLGRHPLARAGEADAVRRFLHEQLDAIAAARFGDAPPPAVVIQLEHLRRRFSALAHWQARQVAEGWRILPERVERELSTELVVDGHPFTITGKIDRVDQHSDPAKGWRLVDYKTGDTAQKPEQTHRAGRGDDRDWVDLQLPLYRELARSFCGDAVIEVGYVCLPKDPDQCQYLPADWTAELFDEALAKAHEVIRQIRQGVFWPPTYPWLYQDDAFAGICMEEGLDRAHALAAGHAALRARRAGP